MSTCFKKLSCRFIDLDWFFIILAKFLTTLAFSLRILNQLIMNFQKTFSQSNVTASQTTTTPLANESKLNPQTPFVLKRRTSDSGLNDDVTVCNIFFYECLLF